MASPGQSETDDLECRLYAYAKSRFKLSARVHMSHLVFETGFKRRMDQRRNVRRLERILKIQGCNRLMKENHVSVIVSQADWQHRVHPRSDNGILPSLHVDWDYGLRALDHENLIVAARNTLAFNNQWWIVDVYVTDEESDNLNATAHELQGRLLQSLRERFSNEHRPSDGLIYERINYYEGRLDGPENQRAAESWWAALESVAGSKKGQYLRLFFKNQFLTRQLNSLLAIPGLWDGMRIGNLHKVTAMHCDEAISCYWRSILTTFLAIVGGHIQSLQLIDGVTVNLIESRVPKVSKKDKEFLQKKFDEGVLFPSFSENDRREIWNRLKEIDSPIPSLKTFFRDRLYLEVPQSVMKQLFLQPNSTDDKVTIDNGVHGLWEIGSTLDPAARKARFRIYILELWRFSFQYGFEMTDWRRLKSSSSLAFGTASSQQHLNLPNRTDIWNHFHMKMMTMGLRTPNAVDLSASPVVLPTEIPCDYPEDASEEVDVKKRSGKPSVDTVEADRYALSVVSLKERRRETRVTSRFLRISVFKKFFGYLMVHDTISGQLLWPELLEDSTPHISENNDEDTPTLYTPGLDSSNWTNASSGVHGSEFHVYHSIPYMNLPDDPGSSFESAPFPSSFESTPFPPPISMSTAPFPYPDPSI
ncbi:hypothetical protein N7481_008453 [Penicillium waksmanii]|uniref:uncharacterized protein n=1 Tax=Penicillium waksmanii TaxID=69791 RepID=UPI002548A9BF|nr:uncharacterized protein N7481_008453 [Penicillium waksmanii]KAJ5974746.1 hypothetical protein N7481_008453 [Penicillium waksmanii]